MYVSLFIFHSLISRSLLSVTKVVDFIYIMHNTFLFLRDFYIKSNLQMRNYIQRISIAKWIWLSFVLTFYYVY